MTVCSHCLSQAPPQRAGALGPPAGGGYLALPPTPGLPPHPHPRPHPRYGSGHASQRAAGLIFHSVIVFK